MNAPVAFDGPRGPHPGKSCAAVVAVLFAATALWPPAAHADDAVLQWNQAICEAIRATDLVANPGLSSRNMAMMNLAAYDAVMGILGTHESFYVMPAAPAGASPRAAATEASYGVLSALYPSEQAALDVLRAQQLGALPADQARTDGMAWGQAVASAILAWRSTDGANDPPVQYLPSPDPGTWHPDPILQAEHGITQEAWGPAWGSLTPFAIASGDQFRPPAPPSFDSPEFLAAYSEAKALGALASATRTQEQTEIGLFWAYDRPAMGPPPIMFNQVVAQLAEQQGNDWLTNVRLFAMTSTALADAGIEAWDAKYAYDLGRPVTLIREAALLGVGGLEADLDWRPLGAPGGDSPDFTPPFPTYVSGHATFGGALFEMLGLFYGTDEISFILVSDEMGVAYQRQYDSFSEAMAENGRSRVYLGIHWSFDDTAGQIVGMAIADDIYGNHFAAIPEPATMSLLALGGLGVLIRRRRER
ncbi:MAG TPA: PEP-CTERM sorting domain-containing protein [Phycisphaerae bacterium]|nr:PEP-CTERM sorting domain-containing protein [Phycisphaerae bacterium]